MLLHHLISEAAARCGSSTALVTSAGELSYHDLCREIGCFASGLMGLGLERAERVGIYLDKRFETVIAFFGTAASGGVFVPINPLLKPDQVRYIVRDCNIRVFITSTQRLRLLGNALRSCADLRHVIVLDEPPAPPSPGAPHAHAWSQVCAAPRRPGHRVIDSDMAAILYTSGSTGGPKGVVLSHRNLVSGATSVARYLENRADDTLLAALPLSFDAGFSQLTTAFHAGARVVLHNYLLPRELIDTIARERVTGLTAVPPLYIQLAQFDWPNSITEHLRYFANTGGRLPVDTLKRLRVLLPKTKPFLMYGLTEAFRATYLAPEEVDRRPDSIGKAIPGSEVLVLRKDGTTCAPDEPGELVQRGPLVAMGYWNDAARTAQRFRPLPAGVAGRSTGLVIPEVVVFSGDTVRQDNEGFLYFIGRSDDMIKTSGYRISPTEIEEVIYDTGLVGEVAVFGIQYPRLGQEIVVVATAAPGVQLTADTLLAACRERLPRYMLPTRIHMFDESLPRNPNGKIDRKALSEYFMQSA